MADLSGLTVEVPQVEETGCFGAALMAMVSDGTFKDSNSALQQISNQLVTVQPDKSAQAKYQAKYRKYRSLVKHLANFNDELRQLTS